MQLNFFSLNSSPDVWFDAILSELYMQFFFTSGLGLCSNMHFQLLDLLLRRVPFQIIPIQLNLLQGNVTQSVVTFTSKMNAPELNFNCPR